MRVWVLLVICAVNMMAALPVSAHAAHGQIRIAAAPPAPRDEIIPGERAGYLWTSGYWDWNGSKHVWRPGHWIEKREGYVWASDTWEQRGEQWELVRGHWETDPDYEDIDDKVAFLTTDTPALHKATKKAASPAPRARKPIDYHNAQQWPRYIKH